MGTKIVVDVNSDDMEGRTKARLLAKVLFMHLQTLSLSPETMQGGLYEAISPLRGLNSQVLTELESCIVELRMPSDPYKEYNEDVHGIRVCCRAKQKVAATKFSPTAMVGETIICPTCRSVWQYRIKSGGATMWERIVSCV